MPAAEVRKLWADHDLFALPTWYEPFGLVFLEARAAGVPILARDAYCMPELVPEECGRLIPGDGGVDAVAEHLLSMSQDAELFASAAEAAERTRAQCTWDTVADRVSWPHSVSPRPALERQRRSAPTGEDDVHLVDGMSREGRQFIGHRTEHVVPNVIEVRQDIRTEPSLGESVEQHSDVSGTPCPFWPDFDNELAFLRKALQGRAETGNHVVLSPFDIDLDHARRSDLILRQKVGKNVSTNLHRLG